MRQLTSVDAQFLAIEDGKTHGHVAALGMYDPSTAPAGELTLDAVRELVAGRLHLLEPFRWRLVGVPFGLDHPYWYDDPDFDLEFHIRELALPAPGDRRMLAEQVARIIARPLDRARPLWELYLVHGLEDGRVAVLTKVHHAAVDGMSGAEILGALLDPAPEAGDDPSGRRRTSAVTSRGSSRCSRAASPASPASGCDLYADCHARCRTSTRCRPSVQSPASPPPQR